LNLNNQKLEFVYDDSYLPESFYKYNNEIAHKALAESSWKDEVSSDDFKEYVLPYKLDYELVDAWRAILYHQYQDLKISNPSCANIDSLVKYYKTAPNPSLMGRLRFNFPLVGNYTVLNTFSRRDCIDRCRYLIYPPSFSKA
jgi:hypothetical protein